MGRNVICPICGAKQNGVDLEKTDGMFECDTCLKVIQTKSIRDDGIVDLYEVYLPNQSHTTINRSGATNDIQ